MKHTKISIIVLCGCLVASILYSQTAPIASTQLSGKGLAIGPICIATNPSSGALSVVNCPAAPPPTTSTYHRYTDLVPVVQSDGSYLVFNPLSGSTVELTSIEVFANGILQTSQPSSTQG